MFSASKVLEPAFQEQPRAYFWQQIVANYAVDESAYLTELIPLAQSDIAEHRAVTEAATTLIEDVRKQDTSTHMVDALLQEYSLNTQEGILLMCLAEALMRIPDKQTADALIEDKLSEVDWNRHLGRSDSMLVNASTWGLLLTGRIVRMDRRVDGSPAGIWRRLVKRSGEPVIRNALYRAMAIMGNQFVLGTDIQDALASARDGHDRGYSYSFDMLGEAALTAADARRYKRHYLNAIEAVGRDGTDDCGRQTPSVSIKLSALHPRYDALQKDRVLDELSATVGDLLRVAGSLGVDITLDAEEMDRLELSLALFERVYQSGAVKGRGGFGLAVQAYSKRALPVLCWLTRLAKAQGDEIPVRLVKGAYWDTEIKLCQQLGLESYPVFTRKEATDTSYLACLRYLLSAYTEGALRPQLASHNAHTVASVLVMSRARKRDVEFQRLHGMGDALYKSLLHKEHWPVRIYAPVGAHQELLPYLVRRLLENGANSSFVHRLVDAATPVETLVQNPVAELQKHEHLPNDRISLPTDIFGEERRNAQGLNLRVACHRAPLLEGLRAFRDTQWEAAALINGQGRPEGSGHVTASPAELVRSVGQVYWAGEAQAERALDAAYTGYGAWRHSPATERAECLDNLADRLEYHMTELIALCGRETGQTLPESLNEVREAVDLCRYYALQARARFGHAIAMPGPTGERNELYMEGRGVFLCISAWCSPLAGFLGQITAALMAGNAVIAKPARQASLVAYRAVELMLEAGFPADVIHLLPGEGVTLGGKLIPDPRIAGIAFTGSSRVARCIHRALAQRDGPIIPLITEAEGLNALVVDSSALAEQVVRDVLHSSFISAGQRRSALRVVYLQEEIADRIEGLLAGAINELVVGHPERAETDVGPMIDEASESAVGQHVRTLEATARPIACATLSTDCEAGYFVAPVAFGVESVRELGPVPPGPVLHVVRYEADKLDDVINDINGTGYGLTVGIHSRSESVAAYIEQNVRVGVCYINRNQVDAVAGVQPFGGLGLSGTGPKAGGPHYLLRFASERTRSMNTTAVGGNASLLSLGVEKVQEK